ncbi:MAG: tetratricopeptide repeat protein, partial [Calditrichaeota bacterium]|nr:tetratricopeptide repeat protein [Calditrichota bacterium]
MKRSTKLYNRLLVTVFLALALTGCGGPETSPMDHYAEGLVHGQQGRFAEARSEFQAALAGDPAMTPAQGGLRIAEDALNDRVSREIAVLLYTGAIHGRNGKFFDELVAYDQAAALQPPYFLTHVFRGNFYSNKKAYLKAIPDYLEAIRLDSTYARSYDNLALCYQQKGQYDQALPLHNRALEKDPNLFEAYYHRAYT